MVSMDLWLCWFVVFHGGAKFGSFVVGLVVVFGSAARGGWCYFLVRVNGGFCCG